MFIGIVFFPRILSLTSAKGYFVRDWILLIIPLNFGLNNKYSVPYTRSLLNAWNADIYLFQEIEDNNSLKIMVDAMDDYSYVISEKADFVIVYKKQHVTYISKKELWEDTPSRKDGDNDY